MTRFKFLGFAATLLALTWALAGCSGQPSANAPQDNMPSGAEQPSEPLAEPYKVSTDPVVLQLLAVNLSFNEQNFNLMMKAPVEAKYPHITLQLVSGVQINALLASGTPFPDIVFTPLHGALNLRDLEVAANLEPYLHKFNLDVQRYDDTILNEIKQYDAKGEIYALPFTRNFSALFYNKDLFNRFGVSFPVDGMTWDEAIALSKRLNRTENDVTYRGLKASTVVRLGSQMSLPLVDPKTEAPLLHAAGWQTVFATLKEMYAGDPNPVVSTALRNDFLKTQTLAMAEEWAVGMLTEMNNVFKEEVVPFDWDMVSLPTFPQAPATERGVDVQSFFLYSGSKHADQAFQVIELISGKDGQLAASRAGRGLTTLNDPEIQQSYAAESPRFKGKNMAGVLRNKPAVNPPASEFTGLATNQLNAFIKPVLLGELDINTALRQADEETAKKIQETKAR